MASKALLAVVVLLQLNSVLAFGGFWRRRLGGLRSDDTDSDSEVSAVMMVLQNQILELTRNYEEQIRELTKQYDDLEEEGYMKQRLLANDFYKLSSKYNSLLRKFQKYEDQCLPEETRSNYQVNTVPRDAEVTYGTRQQNFRSSFFSNGTDNNYQGWEIVFRGLRGNQEDVFDAWNRGGSHKNFDEDCERINCYTCGHWRSHLVDEWDNLGVMKVKIELFKDQKRVMYVIFNGIDSTMSSWFHEDRVLESSYTDLKDDIIDADFNGDFENFQSFLLKNSDGATDCGGDTGWLMVLINDVGECDWIDGTETQFPAFLYSDETNDILFSDAKFADVFVISIMYNDFVQSFW